MALFEGIAFSSDRAAVISMETGLIGLVLAIVLMLAIPYLAGLPVVQLF